MTKKGLRMDKGVTGGTKGRRDEGVTGGTKKGLRMDEGGTEETKGTGRTRKDKEIAPWTYAAFLCEE